MPHAPLRIFALSWILLGGMASLVHAQGPGVPATVPPQNQPQPNQPQPYRPQQNQAQPNRPPVSAYPSGNYPAPRQPAGAVQPANFQQPNVQNFPPTPGQNAGAAQPVLQPGQLLPAPAGQLPPAVNGQPQLQNGQQPLQNGQLPLQNGPPPVGQPLPGIPPVAIQKINQPFQLTPQQFQELEQILDAWEKTSAQVKTFQCDFTRWEYDPVWGPAQGPKTECAGKLKYQAPDKGLFQIVTPKIFDAATGKMVAGTEEQIEHWVCDGTSIYNVKYKEKVMEVSTLPENMRGQAIADGPLPFVFGQKKDKMLARYWVRVNTPPDIQGKEIWLEVFPKYQADAANYMKVDVILSAKDLSPLAIQTHDPGGKNRTVFRLSGHAVNGLWDNFITNFIEPKMPWGFKKVVLNDNLPPAAPNNPANNQAQRPQPGQQGFLPQPPAGAPGNPGVGANPSPNTNPGLGVNLPPTGPGTNAAPQNFPATNPATNPNAPAGTVTQFPRGNAPSPGQPAPGPYNTNPSATQPRVGNVPGSLQPR
ncbi:MAG: hypothetical protein SFX18_07805 [Pirellulales bacterium]|nr:hypothetical protein [Pirellulales bacterium]